MNSASRQETDSMGAIAVPAEHYWGAQTQRSITNFPFGQRMPLQVVHAFGQLKAACAEANRDLGKLDAGIAAVRAERFDLFELVREVAANVHEAEDREVRLELKGLSSGGALDGDRLRLRTSIEFVLRAVLREQPTGTVVVAETERITSDGQIGRAHV